MSNEQISASKMVLLKLKTRKTTAERGYKLLKDKRDGLMKTFLDIIREAKKLRIDAENKLREAQKHFLMAETTMSKEWVISALAVPLKTMTMRMSTKNIMSVRIPVFDVSFQKSGNTADLMSMNTEFLAAINEFTGVVEILIKLAETEKAIENMALEIEKTRRRVNSLEYKMIPEINEILKLVRMKLAEQERGAVVQVMTVKRMIEEQEA